MLPMVSLPYYRSIPSSGRRGLHRLSGRRSKKLELKRCAWALASQHYTDYHDTEWGVPVHDDRKLFEMLILEGVQAGLSWALILRKRAGYLQAFDGFDAGRIARYDERKVQELLANPEIVRNRLKIQAALQNARAFLQVQSDFGSSTAFIWQFVDVHPKQLAWHSLQAMPTST